MLTEKKSQETMSVGTGLNAFTMSASSNVAIFGVTARRVVNCKLGELDIDHMEVGQELMLHLELYEIRSLVKHNEQLMINVVRVIR